MKGHVRKRGNKWCFVLDVGRKPDGSRNRKWFSGYNTKKEAEKACAEMIAQLTQGTYVEPTRKTVAEYMQEWLEYKEKKLRPTTLDTYKRLINNHIIPHIGMIRMDKLHETNIEDLYDYLREEKELAESTIVKIHADILKPAFRRAVRYRILHHNPADIEDPPKHGKPQINVWNQEEMNAFLDAAKGDWMYPVFHLSLNTGMRIGEVLGLQWKYVDFDKKLIYVRQSLTAKTRELTSPKTESSIRDVPFDDITAKILKNQKSAINEKKLRAGSSYNDQDFVFVSGEGAPLLQSNVRRKFNSLIKKAGVPKIRIHDMRHTWATLQLMAGTDIKTVSSILGHSSVWFTYDTYAHVLPEMQKLAVENQLQIIQRKA